MEGCLGCLLWLLGQAAFWYAVWWSWGSNSRALIALPLGCLAWGLVGCLAHWLGLGGPEGSDKGADGRPE